MVRGREVGERGREVGKRGREVGVRGEGSGECLPPCPPPQYGKGKLVFYSVLFYSIGITTIKSLFNTII